MATNIPVSVLKAKALGIVDEVARTGQAVVITKRGKPVARLVPIEPAPSLLGSVTVRVSEDELLASTGEAWHAEQGRS